MTPRERADRARQLLEDAVFLEAMRDIRERIVQQLEEIDANNHEAQHELVLSLQMLQRVPNRFRMYADELVLDKHKAEQMSFMQRMKQSLRA